MQIATHQYYFSLNHFYCSFLLNNKKYLLTKLCLIWDLFVQYILSFFLFFFLYCMYFEKVTLSDCDIWKSLTIIKLYYLRKYIFVHTIQPFSSIQFIESNMQRGKGCFLPYGSGRSDASFTCQVQLACTRVQNKNHYNFILCVEW